MSKYFNRKRLMEMAGLKEETKKPNTIHVTRMDNSVSDMQIGASGNDSEELDRYHMEDALEMSQEKYASGTDIYFIYVDGAGKEHELQIKMNGDMDFDTSNMFDDNPHGELSRAEEDKIVDMISDMS